MKYSALALLFAAAFAAPGSRAGDEAIPVLVIKDHKFAPDKVKVKAGSRFKLTIRNDDPTSEEFESNTMIIEKFIGPKRSITVTLGPLKPGVYEFFGDFHPETAKGQLTAE
jgi:plastocyanin